MYLGFTEWQVSLIGTILWQSKQAGLEHISQKLLQTQTLYQILKLLLQKEEKSSYNDMISTGRFT